MRRLTSSILIGSAVSIGLAWSGGDPAPPGAAAPSGQATYERLCKSCHGLDGRGNAVKAQALKLEPQLLDLARPEAAKLTREERSEILLKGKGKMPAYGAKLKPEEIEPLLEHAEGLVSPPAKGQ